MDGISCRHIPPVASVAGRRPVSAGLRAFLPCNSRTQVRGHALAFLSFPLEDRAASMRSSSTVAGS